MVELNQALERINQDCCPVCGEKLLSKEAIIVQSKLGEIVICKTHIQKNKKQLSN